MQDHRRGVGFGRGHVEHPAGQCREHDQSLDDAVHAQRTHGCGALIVSVVALVSTHGGVTSLVFVQGPLVPDYAVGRVGDNRVGGAVWCTYAGNLIHLEGARLLPHA